MNDENISIEKVLQDIRVIGFNQSKDAIRDSNSGRIYYVGDGELKYVGISVSGPQVWHSDHTIKPGKLKNRISDTDDITIIDKTIFNYLVSEPLSDIKQAHEGLAWGISEMCKSKIKDGEIPHSRTVKSVPGIGSKLTDKILSNMRENPPEI